MGRMQHPPQRDSGRWKNHDDFGRRASLEESGPRRVLPRQAVRRVAALAARLDSGCPESHPASRGKSDFSLEELYGFESELKSLHPQNQNVRPKIRQQLQVLRDLCLISFLSPGNYRVRT